MHDVVEVVAVTEQPVTVVELIVVHDRDPDADVQDSTKSVTVAVEHVEVELSVTAQPVMVAQVSWEQMEAVCVAHSPSAGSGGMMGTRSGPILGINQHNVCDVRGKKD